MTAIAAEPICQDAVCCEGNQSGRHRAKQAMMSYMTAEQDFQTVTHQTSASAEAGCRAVILQVLTTP